MATSDNPLVAGVDSSTQSVKVVIRRADTGELIRQGRAPHPDGTEVEKAMQAIDNLYLAIIREQNINDVLNDEM